MAKITLFEDFSEIYDEFVDSALVLAGRVIVISYCLNAGNGIK